MSCQFYCIRNPWKNKFYYGRIVNYTKNLGKNLLLGKHSNVEPKIQITNGNKAGDFMFTDALIISCVSEKVIKAFKEHKILGWKCYDVTVKNMNKNLIKGYHGLSITGRISGFNTESIYETQKSFGMFRKKMTVQKGLKLDLSEWDQSDLFVIEDKNYIFVSSKVAKLFQKIKFTNVVLGKIEDIEVPLLNKPIEL